MWRGNGQGRYYSPRGLALNLFTAISSISCCRSACRLQGSIRNSLRWSTVLRKHIKLTLLPDFHVLSFHIRVLRYHLQMALCWRGKKQQKTNWDAACYQLTVPPPCRSDAGRCPAPIPQYGKAAPHTRSASRRQRAAHFRFAPYHDSSRSYWLTRVTQNVGASLSYTQAHSTQYILAARCARVESLSPCFRCWPSRGFEVCRALRMRPGTWTAVMGTTMSARGGVMSLVLLCLFVSPLAPGAAGSEAAGTVESPGGAGPGERFKIEGRAVVPGVKPQDWIAGARVLVDGEEHIGFLKWAPCGRGVALPGGPSVQRTAVPHPALARGRPQDGGGRGAPQSLPRPALRPRDPVGGSCLRLRAFGLLGISAESPCRWWDFLTVPLKS